MSPPPHHRGEDVFTATTTSPNMTDGAARTSCCSSQIMADRGPRRRGSLHLSTSISLPLFVPRLFSSPTGLFQVQSNQWSSRIAARRAANRGVAGLQLPKMDSRSESAQELPLEPPSGSRPEGRINTLQFFLGPLGPEWENPILPHHRYRLPASLKVPCSRRKNSFPSDSGPGVCFCPTDEKVIVSHPVCGLQ